MNTGNEQNSFELLAGSLLAAFLLSGSPSGSAPNRSVPNNTPSAIAQSAAGKPIARTLAENLSYVTPADPNATSGNSVSSVLTNNIDPSLTLFTSYGPVVTRGSSTSGILTGGGPSPIISVGGYQEDVPEPGIIASVAGLSVFIGAVW
ncbi:MAG: hypothetical protein ABJA67_02755, partial [Chthonomonadales bacterium]